MSDEEENPVATGLVALVAVALVVGLLAGIAVLLGTRMLGISGDTNLAADEPAAGATMYLPDPVKTERAPEPLISLLPTERPSRQPTRATPPTSAPTTTATEDPDVVLNLNASPLQAAPGDYVMLSGTYRNGEGSVLDIYRKVDGGPWEEFNVDVYVSGGIFQTQVLSWQTGNIQWKVVDSPNDVESDPVTVRIG